MRVYTSSKPKKPRKKKHHSAHDTSAQSLIAQNQKLAVELDDLSHKYEKAKRHERDLRDLREGIEVLESGLRSRSEESMACLGKVDCALQAIEDRVLGSTEAGEGGEDRLADFRHLVPQMRQDLAELRVKVNFGSGAQPLTPERPSTTELEGRSFAGAVSPDTTAESPSSSTEKLLNEYQSALAKTQAEARGLRAKLNSCLGEKSALQQEVEKAFERLRLKEKEGADKLSSMHAREAHALESLHDLEGRVAELAKGQDSKAKRMAILEVRLAEAERQALNLKEENAQLCEDNESLSAFGAKQKKEIDELKHLVSAQRQDIREALALIACGDLGAPRAKAEVGGRTAEQELCLEDDESSGELEAIERAVTDLDFELNSISKCLA